jgi:hypothetical protein
MCDSANAMFDVISAVFLITGIAEEDYMPVNRAVAEAV